MSRPKFTNNEIYHIYNRGVEKINIFRDDGDYIRFIHHLYHFNQQEKIYKNLGRDVFKNKETVYEVEPRTLSSSQTHISILAFVLMPNHFHLLISPNTENSLSKFMQKLGTGYTMFFNDKHKRTGSLFQGKFKSKHINNNSYLLYIPHYIHLNPLKLNVRGSTSYIDNKKYLENYRWSSFQDYIGKKNFPSLTNRKTILDLFGNTHKYQKDINNFIISPQKNQCIIPNGLLIDSQSS